MISLILLMVSVIRNDDYEPSCSIDTPQEESNFTCNTRLFEITPSDGTFTCNCDMDREKTFKVECIDEEELTYIDKTWNEIRDVEKYCYISNALFYSRLLLAIWCY